MRHLSSGLDCAMAGAAIVAAPAAARPGTLIKSRRFMSSPWGYLAQLCPVSLLAEAWPENELSGSVFPSPTLGGQREKQAPLQPTKQKPRGLAPGFSFSDITGCAASAHQPVPDHEAVEAELGDLPPLIAFIGKLGQRGI